MAPNAAQLLKYQLQPVKIVCFGDSITGVYYHTGGVRAYPKMLEIALKRIYPESELQVINAGISGHTTADAMKRIKRDVLRHKPDVVTVMFGMNDVTRVSPADFEYNLIQIVDRCRQVGAEVLFCTPNSIYDEDERRPMEKLGAYSQIVRNVAAQVQAPVVDFFKIWEDLRQTDLRSWRLLMSETIHPGMNGHRLFAERLAQAISGETVSLQDVPPPFPGIRRTLALIAQKQPVKVIAMPPYDTLIGPALKRLGAEEVNVTTWPIEGQSLRDLESWAKQVRDRRPDLVIVAVPAGLSAENEEQFVRSYSWVLNWSLSFGRMEWDCVAALPSVATPELSEEDQAAEALATRIIRGQDIGMLVRPEGDTSTAEAILSRRLDQQAPEAAK